MAIYSRFLMLGAATLTMGTLVAMGCGDSETTNATGGSSAGGSNTGGSNTGGSNTGGSGGDGMCMPTDACERCAATECQTEALACCGQDGCNELVRCVGVECQDAADQMTCALAECGPEVNAALASGGIDNATALGECLTPALEMPMGADCQACADEFGTGGAGGAGGSM